MSDHSSWTDAKRLNLPSNRMTRLLRHNRSASITEGFPLIAAPGEFEIAFGQAVPDLDAPTVTYCSVCQDRFDWPWPSKRRTRLQRCPLCGRDNDRCLTLPRWEFYNLRAGGEYLVPEVP